MVSYVAYHLKKLGVIPLPVSFVCSFRVLLGLVGLDLGTRKSLFAFKKRKQLIENNFFGVWANSPTFNKAAQLRG